VPQCRQHRRRWSAGSWRPRRTASEVTGQHDQYGVLAVQGPRSAEVLGALGLPSDQEYMAYSDAEIDGRPVRVLSHGYTGEHGYELIRRGRTARRCGTPSPRWSVPTEACLRAGCPRHAAHRDGLPLHGQDLSLAISPLQARSGWAVGWKKDAFWGREALTAEKAAGPARLLWGIEALDRGIPRAHMSVVAASGDAVGEVTSGTFSPTLKRGIGLALIDASAAVADGDEVAVDVRGRMSAVRVVKPPFVPSHVR